MADLKTSREEVVRLSLQDSEFFGRTFFPDTLRQPSPPFHRDINALLDDRQHRYVAQMVYRGGAKTTLLRVYVAKRISFGISRTILLVSASQEFAKISLRWLKGKVENNKRWAEFFGIEKAQPWTDENLRLFHKSLGIYITLRAAGITGQLRGLNVDDYRPDLILVDDPCDEENTGTPEQREKVSNIFFGSLVNSLAPTSEAPDSKIVLLQTPLNKEDLINKCHEDPRWASRKYSCFNTKGKSRWEERISTEDLLKDKASYVRENLVSVWLREMECEVVGSENAYFRDDWLQFYELPPERLVITLGIDPVPPPSDKAIETGFVKNDYECLSVAGANEHGYYLLEYLTSRGHSPEWTITKFFELLVRWRPMRVRVEGVGYQRTLAFLLEKEMKKRGLYVQLNSESERRNKFVRIRQAFSGIASQKRLFIRANMTEFRSQWAVFPFCANDDVLDATAMALDELSELDIAALSSLPEEEEEEELLGASGTNWRFAV